MTDETRRLHQLRIVGGNGERYFKSVRLPRMGTCWARIMLDVTIEPSASSASPIWSFVVVNPWPCTHEAEEDVPRGSDYNSHVPAPNHQIAGLRPRDSLKPFDPNVEIGGTRVGVREASSFIDCMH
jgi:hypothetical protein